MGKCLVIVESPAKAKTIQKYLGSGYVVRASFGHVRDLPTDRLGVDIENGFKPEYEIIPRSRKTVKELRELAKKAERVLIASDPDREGEAIAWHLATLLRSVQPNIKRIQFQEITKAAIQNAVRNPTDIDMNRVNAQQTPYLGSPGGLPGIAASVGKGTRKAVRRTVQTVALRIICEREEEIEQFQPETYFTVDAKLTPDDKGNAFDAQLDQIGDHKLEKHEIKDRETAERIVAEIENAAWKVKAVEHDTKRRRPNPAFTTSTLQQEASNKLKFSAKKTMQIAQQLYEGIDLGSETVGLITYMRTDSVRTADEAIEAVRLFIRNAYGDVYLPEKPHVYEQKSDVAQEAHEAIRPTDVTRTPESIASHLTPDQYKLYELIWKRFVASQMQAAQVATVRVEICAGPNYVFKATGATVTFPGYTRVWDYSDKQEKDKSGTQIPPLKVGQDLHVLEIKANERQTKPPERYTEAKLVKELEARGIGRPSTYANIISTLVERQPYVEVVKRNFVPTPIGRTVCRELVKAFPDIFDVNFTSKMELSLDEISGGQRNWKKTLDEFYQTFSRRLQEARQNMAEATPEQKYKVIKPCPACEGGQLVERRGSKGMFYGCTNYPDCRYTEDPKKGAKVPPQPLDKFCPECGEQLVVREGKNGKFISCSGFPNCRHTEPYFEEGEEEKYCPDCGSRMRKIKGKTGEFWGCTRYPECTRTLPSDKDIVGECPECGSPVVKRKPKDKSKKPFYACSAYPNCTWISNEKP